MADEMTPEDLEALKEKTHGILASRLADPDLTAGLESKAVPPSPAAPTNGPNRYTIQVPFDTTVLSLGQAAKDSAKIADRGIRGHTDQHVHWYARSSRTYLRLGEHSVQKDRQEEGYQQGYNLFTDGESWQHIKKNSALRSAEGNILVKTLTADKTVGLFADGGYLEAVAGKQSTVAAGKKVYIVAGGPLGTEDVAPGVDFKHMASQATASSVAKALMSFADCVASGCSIFRTFSPHAYGAFDERVGWKTEPTIDKPKVITDIVKLASSTLRLSDEVLGLSGLPKVSIAALGSVSATGDVSASIYGNASASVTSALSASLLGGTASVKGFAYTSVWAGIEVSLKGRRDAKMEGETGKASVKGKKGVEVSSYAGAATVLAKKDARLASTHGKTFVYGDQGAQLVSGGPQSGFGVTATVSEVRMGRVEGDSMSLKAMAKIPETYVLVDAKGIDQYGGGACVVLRDGTLFLGAKGKAVGVKLDKNGDLAVESAGKILFG